MSAIWAACADEAHPVLLSGQLWRLVESQEQIATTEIVDTLEEQALLEELLEATKPPLPGKTALHYLLRTPFRYPPLPFGSRFGSRFEPSLFYGSITVGTMLAESAFYRFLFWYGMRTPPARAITSQHTAFTAKYRTTQGLRLQMRPFDNYHPALTDPTSYAATQPLGTAMRAAGIEAFEFISARDQERGLNVALFTPEALASTQPLSTHRWVCQTDALQVDFLDEASRAVHGCALEIFLIEGVLPRVGLL
ncbi:MAG TPA: RES family NAD+ phosphorylase [Gammaproteobacteria bacterium]|nr:RES family NAD+ phosphorylase [Gammaproteobacteria bacterium]